MANLKIPDWELRQLFRACHGPEWRAPSCPLALRNDLQELIEFKAGLGECPHWYEVRAAELRIRPVGFDTDKLFEEDVADDLTPEEKYVDLDIEY
ncbi:MAG: hypothetical protein FJY85_10085 [Deltaproteobacteria bacterium]|nr:hypothetical protein [Deltaproteobacteria bacterium]